MLSSLESFLSTKLWQFKQYLEKFHCNCLHFSAVFTSATDSNKHIKPLRATNTSSSLSSLYVFVKSYFGFPMMCVVESP